MHIKKVVSNRDINLTVHRLLLLSVIRPSIKYGGEIWEGNKGQVAALQSIILVGAERILGFLSKTCNEAVRGDMGTLPSSLHTDSSVTAFTCLSYCFHLLFCRLNALLTNTVSQIHHF